MDANTYINGKLIGKHPKPIDFVKKLKGLRRGGKLSTQLNVSYFEDTNEVYIHTDSGRARRPLIVIDNGKPRITEEQMELLKFKTNRSSFINNVE